MPTKSEVIVLIGPMGVGKSTVGKKLARLLKVPFLDTDNLIVDEHGKINDIFATQGEDAFRTLEHTALATAITQPGVVATGGGAILRRGPGASRGRRGGQGQRAVRAHGAPGRAEHAPVGSDAALGLGPG